MSPFLIHFCPFSNVVGEGGVERRGAATPRVRRGENQSGFSTDMMEVVSLSPFFPFALTFLCICPFEFVKGGDIIFHVFVPVNCKRGGTLFFMYLSLFNLFNLWKGRERLWVRTLSYERGIFFYNEGFCPFEVTWSKGTGYFCLLLE
jgi:hypothetical protein